MRRKSHLEVGTRESQPGGTSPAAPAITGPEQLPALVQRDPAARAQAIGVLQRSCGNAAVARLLRAQRAGEPPAPAPTPAAPPPRSTSDGPMVTHSETQSFRLEANIRIGTPAGARSSSARIGGDADSEPGHDKHDELSEIQGKLGSATVPASPAPEAAPPAEAAPADGSAPAGAAGASGTAPAAVGGAPGAAGEQRGQEEAPVHLPDIEVRDFENIELCDAISPSLSYSGTISQGGAPPTGFGVTRPGPMTVRDISVWKIPLLGWWRVSATIAQQIQFQVRAALGPSGQVNISSSTDSAITGGNWTTVASDLTPNMSDLNGRPPRTQFWSKDLTERHEHYHANDRKTRAPAALRVASRWLGTQQAASVADVQTLLAQVPGRVVAGVSAGMTMPGKEERAYGDGAGAYWRRATAIRALGNLGYY